MSNIKPDLNTGAPSLRQVIMGNLKRRLVAYPVLYELIINLVRSTRRLLKYLLIHLKDLMDVKLEHSSSLKHVSKEQGLMRIIIKDSKETVEPLQPYLAHYESNQSFSSYTTDIKAIAYHLPQFHAIPENDEWWGNGFTEWTNTRKAKAMFPGHYQPREPHDDIGYYDLSDVESIRKQVILAKEHGIYGFCFYHYWFHGKRLLGKPVDLLLEHADIDMPFCFCWANETWSKRWDGRDHHILMQQTFSPEDDIRFIEFLEPYLRDSRYIRVDGKPLLMVYRISKLPDPLATTNRWRNWAREKGIGELHLVSACHSDVFPHTRLKNVGFDAYAAFPPHNFPCKPITSDKGIFDGGRQVDYGSGVDSYSLPDIDTPIYGGCTMGWDNTPRFGRNATLYINFSLNKYYTWMRKVIDYTRATFLPKERFIFINAWNEWAEGTYLEPDKKYGYACINTTSRALFDVSSDGNESDDDALFIRSSSRYTKDYERLKSKIENQEDNSLAAINLFIKPQSHILEFGSSSGYFTRYLKEERQAIVDIIEIDVKCAETAAGYARDCYIGDIEEYKWKDAYANRTYDYILFADVLEHMRDPWLVLKEAVKMLNPNGRIIISVPNIAHIQILASLYNNDFSYTNRGILDNSHLRFFTESTMRHMIEEAGLEICKMIPIQCIVLPDGCGTKWNNSGVPAKVRRILAEKQHAYTMQFVACCKMK